MNTLRIRNADGSIDFRAKFEAREDGSVEYRRNRWWRWNGGLMELITPRQHDGNMWPWTIPMAVRRRKCADTGCYICRDLIANGHTE